MMKCYSCHRLLGMQGFRHYDIMSVWLCTCFKIDILSVSTETKVDTCKCSLQHRTVTCGVLSIQLIVSLWNTLHYTLRYFLWINVFTHETLIILSAGNLKLKVNHRSNKLDCSCAHHAACVCHIRLATHYIATQHESELLLATHLSPTDSASMRSNPAPCMATKTVQIIEH